MITQYFSPISKATNSDAVKNNGTHRKDDKERRQTLIKIYTTKMERAILGGDKAKVQKIVKEGASLPESYIEELPNEFIKFLIRREIISVKNAEAMKNMTVEERRTYRKDNAIKMDENQDYKKLVHLLLNTTKREDLLLLNLKPLPDFPLVDLPCEISHNCFGRCLVLTEFFNTFRDLFKVKHFYSAEVLAQSLTKAENGFINCIGHILKALMHFLLDNGFMKEFISVRNHLQRQKLHLSSRIDDVSKLAIIIAEEMNMSNTNGLDAGILTAIKTLSISSNFYDLDTNTQLIILEFFMDTILKMENFRSYLVRNEVLHAKALQDKKELEIEIYDLQKYISEMPAITPLDEDGPILTRRQRSEFEEKEKLKNRTESELEDLREKLSEQEELIVQSETIVQFARVSSLGFDRFYRRYWFFGVESPNSGIFVEQEYKTKKFEETPAAESFMEKLRENLYGRPPPSDQRDERWHAIKSEKLLNALIDSLSNTGLREFELLQNIRSNHDSIVKTLNPEEGNKENVISNTMPKNVQEIVTLCN